MNRREFLKASAMALAGIPLALKQKESELEYFESVLDEIELEPVFVPEIKVNTEPEPSSTASFKLAWERITRTELYGGKSIGRTYPVTLANGSILQWTTVASVMRKLKDRIAYLHSCSVVKNECG